MGYCMTQRDQSFLIKAENKDCALEAIRNLDGHYSWVTGCYKEAKTLEKAMSDWCWDAEEDSETGDIHYIYFSGEKLGDEQILFDAIAPFVEEFSFIQMVGEDGTIWRWHFTGAECFEESAKITWE